MTEQKIDYCTLLEEAQAVQKQARRLFDRKLKPRVRDNAEAFEEVELRLYEAIQRAHQIEAQDFNGPIGRMMRRLRRQVCEGI